MKNLPKLILKEDQNGEQGFFWNFLIGKKQTVVKFGKPIYNLGDDEEKGVQRVMEEIEKLI